jgi:hypothetical protein
LKKHLHPLQICFSLNSFHLEVEIPDPASPAPTDCFGAEFTLTLPCKKVRLPPTAPYAGTRFSRICVDCPYHHSRPSRPSIVPICRQSPAASYPRYLNFSFKIIFSVLYNSKILVFIGKFFTPVNL